MRGHKTTTQSIALALTVLLTICNLPLSAADKTAPATIGSVNSVGSVQLRGVALSSEGTLFSGDRLTVGPGSYARVVAGTGLKLAVEANSDVVVSQEGNNTNLQMTSGNVGFKGNGKGSTRVRIGGYDVAVSPDAAGNISFVGSEAFGIRIIGGSATVRHTQTKKSFVVQKGSERLVSLTTGANSPTMAQLASTLPSAVPALPRRQASSSWSTGMWVSVAAVAAGGATLVTYFLAREDGDARAAQTQALTNLGAISQTAAATSTVAAQSASVASQAQAAINASSISTANKTALTNQVTNVTNLSNSAAGKIQILNTKITALQNKIAAKDDGPSDSDLAELGGLINDLNSARGDANGALAALLALLTNAIALGVPGVPAPPNAQPVPPANVGSASIPV